MNTILILLLLFIAYIFYINTIENYTDEQTTYAKKIFIFLSSSNKSYIDYLTFLNDEKIPKPKLFSIDVYNKFKNAIKTGTLTFDNLNLIYDERI